MLSGGAILALLAKRPEYSVTVTVRQQVHADKFESLGFKAVIATLDDAEILEKLASEADSQLIACYYVNSPLI